MKKDFTITTEVRLFAHWKTPMDSLEEWERRKAVDDRLGVLACDLEKIVDIYRRHSGISQENPGKNKFSEPETKSIKYLFSKKKYTSAVDVHG